MVLVYTLDEVANFYFMYLCIAIIFTYNDLLRRNKTFININYTLINDVQITRCML